MTSEGKGNKEEFLKRQRSSRPEVLREKAVLKNSQ